MSTIEDPTYINCHRDDDPPESELVLWAQEALGKLGTSNPEEDLRQMAISMEIEVAEQDQVEPSSSCDIEPLNEDRFHPQVRFLSEKDKQYIRTLVVMGYQEEAARLVGKAYERRSKEIEMDHALEMVDSQERPLFAIFHVEYLEMLLLVGQRKRAIEVVMGLMDDYELSALGRVVRTVEAQSRLEKEYQKTIVSIDTTGTLPPEEEEVETNPTSLSAFFRRLARSFSRRR